MKNALIALLLFVVAAAFAMCWVNQVRIAESSVGCGSHLRQIGNAIRLYASDRQGQYPPTFDLLFSLEELDADVACCPGPLTSPPSTHPSAEWLNTKSDYIYLGAGLDTAAPADIFVAHDRFGNHGKYGVNVLFGDGHVEFVATANWDKYWSASQALRSAWEATTRSATRSDTMPITRGTP